MTRTSFRSRCSVFATSAALALLSTPSLAAVVVLDFEGSSDLASLNNFYNGGTDSAGNSGTDHGIRFSDTSLAIIDADAGGSGNFANEPSPSTVLFFLSGGAATMNVEAGFDTGFSFFYASNATDAGSVTVYDGVDATGNILATLDLTPNGGGCAGDPNGFPFCNFTAFGVTFSGIARSVDFGGVANQIAFDDVTLGTDQAGGGGGQVPEPSTIGLIGLGVMGVGFARRRRKTA